MIETLSETRRRSVRSPSSPALAGSPGDRWARETQRAGPQLSFRGDQQTGGEQSGGSGALG